MSEHKNYSSEGYLQTENKLLLLYLVDKMEIPLSYSQISQFALEENYMSYFTLQTSLSEMTSLGFLDKTQDNNNTRYSITEEGFTMIEYFEKQIPSSIRNKINQYVLENRKSIKKDYEITSNYFYDHGNNEFIVKCGVYEDETMLMEINLSVVTREQAKLICKSWKANVNNIYGNIISELIKPDNSQSTTDTETKPMGLNIK